MKQITLLLLSSFFLISCAYNPTTGPGGSPNIMVFIVDGDGDSVSSNSQVSRSVQSGLRSRLSERGFDVYDETAARVRSGYDRGRHRRSDAEVVDIARSLDSPPMDYAVVVEVFSNAKDRGYASRMRTRISAHVLTVQSGRFVDDFEVSGVINGSACNGSCMRERAAAQAYSLALDLGDVLAEKLSYRRSAPRSNWSDGGGSGIARGYNLIFNNFASDERLTIEEYLVVFSGYKYYRPVDCSRCRCEYWYRSTISSANSLSDFRGHPGRIGSYWFSARIFP